MALLSIRNVSWRFAGLTALDDVSFDVEEGSVVGLIGPNGAGKTTLINMITGMFPANVGEILFAEESIIGLKPHLIARKGIARTFQQIRLFDALSVAENVMIGLDTQLRSGYAASAFGLPGVRREEAQARHEATKLLARVCGGLQVAPQRCAAELPYADKRRLEIARALASRPRLLLLDEPACGMAPQEIKSLIEDLKRLNQEGTTIMLIEHKMSVIENGTHKVVVLDHGKKIAEGSFDRVKRDARVVEAYLGRGYANAATAAH